MPTEPIEPLGAAVDAAVTTFQAAAKTAAASNAQAQADAAGLLLAENAVHAAVQALTAAATAEDPTVAT